MPIPLRPAASSPIGSVASRMASSRPVASSTSVASMRWLGAWRNHLAFKRFSLLPATPAPPGKMVSKT